MKDEQKKLRLMRFLLIRIARIFLMFVVFSSVLIEILGESGLLGPFIIRRARLQAEQKGLVFDATSARIGLFQGLAFRNVVIRDLGPESRLLAEFDRISISLDGAGGFLEMPKPERIRIYGGNIYVPWPGIPEELLQISDFEAELKKKSVSNWEIRNLAAGTPGGGVKIRGNITGFDKLPPPDPDVVTNLSFYDFFARLKKESPESAQFLREFLQSLNNPDQKSEVDLSINLALDDLFASQINGSFSLTGVKLIGLEFEELAADFQSHGQVQKISDVKLQTQEDYFLGSFVFDRETLNSRVEIDAELRPDLLNYLFGFFVDGGKLPINGVDPFEVELRLFNHNWFKNDGFTGTARLRNPDFLLFDRKVSPAFFEVIFEEKLWRTESFNFSFPDLETVIDVSAVFDPVNLALENARINGKTDFFVLATRLANLPSILMLEDKLPDKRPDVVDIAFEKSFPFEMLWNASGTISINDQILNGVRLNDGVVELKLDGDHLHTSFALQCVVQEEELFAGEIKLNLATLETASSLELDLRADLWSEIRAALPRSLTNISLSKKNGRVQGKLSLSGVGVDFCNWFGDGELQITAAQVRGLELDGSAKVELEKDTKLLFEMMAKTKEAFNVQLNGFFDMNNFDLEGKFVASAEFSEFRRLLPFAVRLFLRQFQATGISFVGNFTGDSLRANLSCQSFGFSPQSKNSASFDFVFEENKFSIPSFEIAHPVGGYLRGNIAHDLVDEKLACEFSGLISNIFYKDLLPPGYIAREAAKVEVEKFEFKGAIPAFRPEVDPLVFYLEGNSGKGRYDALKFESINGLSLRWEPKDKENPDSDFVMRLEIEKSQLSKFEKMWDLELVLNPSSNLELEVSCVGSAHPLVAASFISYDDSRKLYEEIWDDFTFDERRPPLLELKSVKYSDGPEPNDWQSAMHLVLHAEDFAYKKIQVDHMLGEVKADFRKFVDVNLKQISGKEGMASGSLFFDFSDSDAFCDLKFKGVLEPTQVLLSFVPYWENLQEFFAFSANTEIQVQGRIPLVSGGKLRLQGNAVTNALKAKNLPFQNFSADWEFQDQRLIIDNGKGKLFNGDFETNLNFDTETLTGDWNLLMADVDVAQLLANNSEEQNKDDGEDFAKNDDMGLLEAWAELKLSFPKINEEHKLRLNGLGEIKLEGGRVWALPIFRSFADVLKIAPVTSLVSVGDVTRVNLNLVFIGDRVILRNLNSDGGLVSLRNVRDGHYYLDTDKIEMFIQGRLLQQTGIVPLLARPLSWLFEVHLTGTLANPKLNSLGGLRRLF